MPNPAGISVSLWFEDLSESRSALGVLPLPSCRPLVVKLALLLLRENSPQRVPLRSSRCHQPRDPCSGPGPPSQPRSPPRLHRIVFYLRRLCLRSSLITQHGTETFYTRLRGYRAARSMLPGADAAAAVSRTASLSKAWGTAAEPPTTMVKAVAKATTDLKTVSNCIAFIIPRYVDYSMRVLFVNHNQIN